MLQVALIEDNPRDLECEKKYLIGYFKERDQRNLSDYHMSCYTSGSSFMQDFEAGKFDALLLDIYMPNMSGMDVARRVRLVDPDVCIIFLTSSKDHALDSYSVFAAGYVLKPLSVHGMQLSQTLDRFLPEEAARAASVTVRLAGQQTLAIPYRKILYVDTDESRGAVFHLQDKTITTQCAYKDAADILGKDGRFLECYHRILINMDYITSMVEDHFILKGAKPLPISRRKKKDVQMAYAQYLLGK